MTFLIFVAIIIITVNRFPLPQTSAGEVNPNVLLNFLKVANQVWNGNMSQTDMNNFSDQLIVIINKMIDNKQVEPIQLPEYNEEFHWSVIFGKLQLKNGILRGLSTIKRQGDVTVTYDPPKLDLQLILGLQALRIYYDYVCELYGHGPTGNIIGKSDDSKFTVEINTDNLTALNFNLKKFTLNNIGEVSVDFEGNKVVGSLGWVIVDAILPLLKRTIKDKLESELEVNLRKSLEDYNKKIVDFLKKHIGWERTQWNKAKLE